MFKPIETNFEQSLKETDVMPDLLANALADKVVSVEVMFMAPLVQPESLEVLHDPDRTSARCAIHSATVSNRCIFVCNTCKLHGVSITYSRSLEFRRHYASGISVISVNPYLLPDRKPRIVESFF